MHSISHEAERSMIGRLLERLSSSFRSPATTENHAGSAVLPIAADVAIPEAAPFPQPTPAVAGPDQAAAVERAEHRFRQEFNERSEALRESLPDEMKRDDAPALLESLGAGMDVVIRQPPLAAQEALAMCRNTEASIGQIVALFQRDPILTQALLRQANSSYYARGGGTCISMLDAAVRVGTKGAYNVLLGSMVEGMLCRPGGSFGTMLNEVWTHMVRTAPIARRIGPAFGVGSEPAFALGLLHDMGKLVLFERISALRSDRRRDVRLSPTFVRWALRRLHEPLGALAVLRWGLGEEAAAAVARHHRQPPPEAGNPRSEVIFVAERADLAEVAGRKLDLEEVWTVGELTGNRQETAALLGL
ncbi:MAG: HDOD domain-containing protein [Gemmatimonadota bacterium]